MSRRNQTVSIGNHQQLATFENPQHLAGRGKDAETALEPSFDMDNQVVVVVVATVVGVQSSQPTISSVLNKLRAKRLHSCQLELLACNDCLFGGFANYYKVNIISNNMELIL
ncbi:hypothetical protein ACH5RR_039174 [Cinchona calisaya]|uniref:Uncharacterized protein n=1 Tax=Cinchona calisaya TaxID=153742 RepID=A0ABD2Y004_9GENT